MFNFLRGSKVTGYINGVATNGYPDLGSIGCGEADPPLRPSTEPGGPPKGGPPGSTGRGLRLASRECTRTTRGDSRSSLSDIEEPGSVP